MYDNFEKPSSFRLGIRRTCRIMKLIVLCLVLGIGICYSNDNYSQTARVSLHLKNRTIKQVLSEIEKKTEYVFFYQDNVLDGNRKVTVNTENRKVSEVLDEILLPMGNTYFVSDRQIYVIKKNEPRPVGLVKKQQRQVKGKVTNESGETMAGASVVEKGTTNGTTTDEEGLFTLEDCDNNSVLQISFIGYKTRDILVGDLGFIDVKLESESIFDEIVVVGAGTQKKVSVTGAITTVKGSELRTPSSSLTNNLAGKLSGVVAMTNSGEPGSTSQFYIRGIGTFGGRATPLILLDGVEISAGDLNNIPPEAIESFSILKDASATAIYGARGANGVMLVTTKSGIENERARINVSIENSFLKPVNIVDYADGATFMETYNNALLSRNPSAQLRYTPEQIANTRNGVNPYVFPDVDWYDLMFKDHALSQRANVNVQGGGSKVVYYMNMQVNHDGGLLDVPEKYSFDNNYNRWLYTFQNNIGYSVTPTTKLDLRMNAQVTRQTSPDISSNDIFYQIFTNTPVSFPATFPEDDAGHIKFGSAVMSPGRFYTNPYANMLNSFRETNSNKLNVSMALDQKLNFLTEGLFVTSLLNFNNYSNTFYSRSLAPFLYSVANGSWDEANPDQFSLSRLQVGAEYINQSDVTRASDNTFYFDARLNYDRKFGKHAVTGMFMYMMREFRLGVLPNRNQGLSGRMTYDYDNRYLAEFNFGYNGTERLAKNQRFEFFPAMSLGWVASNEGFWEPIAKYVDYFKLRGSYGLVGSDETGLYDGAPHFLYLNVVDMWGGPSFSSGYTGNYTLQGPVVNTYATYNPSWERSTQFDIGVDMRLLNTVNVTFDYYHNKRDRILMRRASFPSMLGYANAVPWANIGKVENKGIELSVNWQKQLTEDLSVDIRGNYTYTQNKYIYVDEPDYPYTWQTNTGKPLGHTRGYIADGLFRDVEDIRTHADQTLFGSVVMPGDIKYRDINGDGRITVEDQVMLSSYGNMPRIQYGLGISMTYKKLDMSVFFNGSAKRRIMLSNVNPFSANDSNDRNLMQWIADSYWMEGEDNSNVSYPRLGTLGTQITNNLQPSSFWMRKGDFIRFKTLEVGYRLPYCRVYFSGDNLAVWSPFDYWDPELAYNTYPLQRTLNLGVQFNF